MAAHNFGTLAERVWRDLDAKRRLLGPRTDEPLEPAALRELMGAIDEAEAALTLLRHRCTHEEDTLRAERRAASRLVGGRGFGSRGRQRAELHSLRSGRQLIDRKLNDVRHLRTDLRPKEIDLRETAQPTPDADPTERAAVPPPPARLVEPEAGNRTVFHEATRSDAGRRPPTEHERAMLEWLAQAIHDVIATRPRSEWADASSYLVETYADRPQDLDHAHDDAQTRLLASAFALGHHDQRTAVTQLTTAYTSLRQVVLNPDAQRPAGHEVPSGS